jgi:hypothetical protein
MIQVLFLVVSFYHGNSRIIRHKVSRMVTYRYCRLIKDS